MATKITIEIDFAADGLSAVEAAVLKALSTPVDGAVETPAAKPAPAPRTRRAPAKKAEPAPEPEAEEEEVEAEAEEAEEAPAKKAPARKPAAKKAEEPKTLQEELDELGPEDEAPAEVTMDDAVAAATDLVSKGRQAEVKAALEQFGAARVSKLAQKDLAAFIQALAA